MTRRSSSNKKMSLVVVIALLMSLVAFIDSPLRANAQVAAPDAPSVPVVEFTADNGNLGYSFTAPNGTNDNGSAITQFNVRTYTGSPRQLVNGATCSILSSAAIKKCAIVNDATNTYFQQGNNYEFSLSATNANGTSAETFVDEITFSATAPSSPTNLQATVTNDTATVSLQPPSATPNSSLNGGVALKSYRVDAYPANPRTSQSVGSCLIAASQQTVNGVVEETAGSCAINNLPIGSYVFSATATNCTVSGLENGRTYTFRVLAVNPLGESAVSANDSVTLKILQAPRSPSYATARRAGPQTLRVTWVAPVPTASAGGPLRGYRVVANDQSATSCSTNLNSGANTNLVQASSTTCDITGLTNGTSYAVSVFAVGESGMESAASVSASETVAGPPDAPTSFVATRGDRSIAVTWVAPATNGLPITGYRISNAAGVVLCSASASDRACLIRNLQNGVAATLSITALSNAGTSNPTTASAVTPAGVPFAPKSVTATPGDASATVTITPADSLGGVANNNGDAIMRYEVVDAITSEVKCTITPNGAGGAWLATPVCCAVTGLTNGSSFRFGARAVNAIGNSSLSSANTIKPSGVPSAPRNFRKLSESDGRVLLAWDAPTTDNGSSITGYEVSSGAGNPRCLIVGVGATSCRVSGLSNGTTFTFTVKARNGALGTNSAGEVGLSESAAAVTASPGRVPKAPSNITATNARDGILVQWDQLSSSGTDPENGGRRVTKYIVSAVQNSAVTCEAVPNPARPTDPAARGCKVIGAQLGISYSFKVFAINEFGDGDIAYSTARGTAFGMPSAPSNMRGVEGNPTIGRDFDVKWDPPTTLNASTIASYEVRQTFTFRNLNVNFHLNNQVSSSVICTVGAIQPRSCSAFMTNGNPISFDITPTVSTPSLDADGNLVTGTTNGPTGTFTFVPSGLPFAPASLSATAGDQSIVATWNEAGFRKIFGDWINTPGDGGSPITSYRVVAKNAANGAVESQCVVSSPVATGNRCTLMNLRNGTTYNISVVAVNVKGSSTEAVFNGVTPTK